MAVHGSSKRVLAVIIQFRRDREQRSTKTTAANSQRDPSVTRATKQLFERIDLQLVFPPGYEKLKVYSNCATRHNCYRVPEALFQLIPSAHELNFLIPANGSTVR